MAATAVLLGTAAAVLFQAGGAADRAQLVRALERRAVAALEAKDYHRAVAAFTRLIELEPKAARAYLGRGIAFYHIALPHELEGYWLSRGAGSDLPTTAPNTRAADRALADYDRAVELGLKTAGLYTDRGMLHAELRHLDRALADFSEAIRLDPDLAKAHFNRALAYEEKGEFARAVADYDHVLRLGGRSAFVYTSRANVHARCHAYDRAVADYAEALRLNPSQADAYNGLAWLRATCPDSRFRDGKKAVAWARKACELTDWKVDAYIDTLAAACAEAGAFKEAVRWTRKILEPQERIIIGVIPVSYMKRIELTEQEREEVRQRRKLYQQNRPYREE